MWLSCCVLAAAIPSPGRAANGPEVTASIVPVTRPSVALAAAATTPTYAPVCSNGQYPGDNWLTSAGQEWESRQIYYCPQGAKVIQLMFTGGYAVGTPPVEAQLPNPVPMTLSVETYVPPVWNPNVIYHPGDQVSAPVTVDNGSGTYVAVAANETSLPTAFNKSRWLLTTPNPIPITCNGGRACTLGTHVNAAGQTVANAVLLTDPLNVDIAPGSLIAIRAWVHQSGSQVMADGPAQAIWADSYTAHAAAVPDLTLGGAVAPSGSIHKLGPLAILGVQNVAKPVPTVCIIGDSRVEGVAGNGVQYVTIANGGSGYNWGDIGRLVTNVDTGGSPDNPIASAIYVIQNVTGDHVSQVGVYDAGHYAFVETGGPGVASSNPIGVQPTSGTYNTWGHGLTVTIPSGSVSNVAGLYEDPKTFAEGFLQKGLSDGGIPFVSFSRSGDRITSWAAPGGDTNRLAAIQQTGCSSVLISLGINDEGDNLSAATIEAGFETVAQQLLALGTVKAVYPLTIFPAARSTDYWVTAKNQFSIGNEAVRTGFNDWARAVPSPFAGVFDTTAAVEVNKNNVLTRNGGLWITNGTPHYPTPDFVHLSPATQVLAAAVITANIGILK
jgi:hypothetical protein